jgi:cell division septum initiation protein DivIVA
MPKKAKPAADEAIDLGIMDGAAAPTLAETLYAGRIASGDASMPEDDSPSFTPGTRQALAAMQAESPAASGEVVDKVLPASDSEGRDLINQLLGQAQAFSAASQLLQTFGVSKLAYVKENGLYKHLAGINTPNGLELRGTWEEFCGLLGMSDEKANQDIANLRAFGEEALESMNRMGIGYRELRQFRKLPPDQREALALIAKTGNRDDLLEAAYDAIEKERTAAQELQVKNAELAEDLKASERRAKNLDAECERKDSQIKRLAEAKKRTTEFLLRTEEIREECMALQLGAELNLNSLQKLFEEVRAEDPSLPEWRLQIEQIWVTAHVVAARALDMVERMKDSVRDGEMPERVMGQHILTPAEAQRWMLDYPMIENRHAADAAARQEKRDAAKPKGPGRPKGSTNKTAAGE